jgi:hypothetical protein
MSYLSLALVTKEKDGSTTRVPIITGKPLDEIVKELSVKWDIIGVQSNDGSMNYEVENGVVIYSEHAMTM